MTMFNGMRVVVSEAARRYKMVQHSRSPSRAKRRARRGYRQHYIRVLDMEATKALVIGDTLIVSPEHFQMLKGMTP